MLTLAIDTSTTSAGIALLRDDEVLAETFVNLGLNHSLVLLPALDHILKLSRLRPQEIDLFACTIGPGSFTGLRIGASTVKGLAMATGSPIAGVSTLEALALNIAGAAIYVCPMLDAKKDQVYAALYSTGRAGTLEEIIGERVTGIREFLQAIDGEVMFLGDGTVKYAALIKEILRDRFYIASNCHQHVRASAVGLLGRQKFSRGETFDSVTFAPKYLRLSEAEANRFSR